MPDFSGGGKFCVLNWLVHSAQMFGQTFCMFLEWFWGEMSM